MSRRSEWTRIFVRNKTRDISKGLSARIADPYWMLGRQWQLGEFKGDDASSPVSVTVDYESVDIDQLSLINSVGAQIKTPILNGEILEPFVEGESFEGSLAFERMALEAGLHFARYFAENVRPAILDYLRNKYPISLKVEVEDEFLKLLYVKSFSAKDFYKNKDRDKVSITRLAAISDSEVASIFTQWSLYFAEVFEKSGQNFWQNDRLEYKFKISNLETQPVQVELESEEYDGSQLDWFHFKLRQEKTNSALASNKISMLPNAVRYVGMPQFRFWDFEDGEVFFGGLEVGVTDIQQMLFAEFATVYSNDWFYVPLTLPIGSLSRVKSFNVVDSFGEKFEIKPAAVLDGANRKWKFFELEGDRSIERGLAPWLFLPSTTLAANENEAIEKVCFFRDESSNLVWAIEETIESATEIRVSRQEQWMENLDLIEQKYNLKDQFSCPEEMWRYRFASYSPGHWIPFAPQVENNRPTHKLVRSRMPEWKLLGDLEKKLAGPKGCIMPPERAMQIYEEEILEQPIEVTRNYQITRNSKGNAILWCGRKKRHTQNIKAPDRKADYVEKGNS